MAAAFNLTAQLNLVGPTNVKKIASDIRREIGTVTGEVKFKIDQSAIVNAGKLNTQLKRLNDTLAQTRVLAGQATGSVAQLGSSLGNVKLSKISSDSSKASRGIESIGDTSKKAAKDVGVMSNELAEFGRQSGLAIRRFAAFSIVSSVVYKLNSALSSAIGNFIDFDKELVRVAQVTGKDINQLDGLVNEITRLSTSLGVTSDDLIKVSSTLAQAGLSAQETEQALKALALSANAPSFDSLNDTVEGSIALMRQFGIKAKDLEQALGAVNAVSAQFAVEAGDIITAIQRTGGVFATASRGVSSGTDALNEFIAVFTSIRATTRESAETIATGLRTIFARIQRKDTIEALKEYGVVLTDLEGKFVGPYEAVRRLSEGLSKLDPRDLKFSQIVEELGGFRQIGKVIPLIQQFATAEDALRVAQQGAGSLAADNAKAQLALANKLTKVREEFVSLVREFGKNTALQSFLGLTLSLTGALLKLVRAGKGLFPLLTLIAGMKAVSGITQFAGGFAEGVRPKTKGGSVSRDIGTNIGEILTGSKSEKESQNFGKAASAIDSAVSDLSREISSAVPAITQLATNVQQHMVELSANTAALMANTSSIDALTQIISSTNFGGGGPTLNSGGIVRKFATGGLVPGSGDKDTVPAMLTPGEFVMRKTAVKGIGRDNLSRMNKYAAGGVVIDKINKIDKTVDGDTFDATVTPKVRQFHKRFRVAEYDAWEQPNNRNPEGYSTIPLSKFEDIQKYNKKVKIETKNASKKNEIKIRGDTYVEPGQTAIDLATEAKSELANKINKSKLDKLSSNIREGQEDFLGRALIGGIKIADRLTTGRTFNLGGKVQKFAVGGEAQSKKPVFSSSPTPILQGILQKIEKNPKSKDYAFKSYQEELAAVLNQAYKGILVPGSRPTKDKVSRDSVVSMYDEYTGSGYIKTTIGALEDDLKYITGENTERGALKKNKGVGVGDMLDTIRAYQALGLDYTLNTALATGRTNETLGEFQGKDLSEAYKIAGVDKLKISELVKRMDAAAQYKFPEKLYSGLGDSKLDLILKETGTKEKKDIDDLIGKTFNMPSFISASNMESIADSFARTGMLTILTNPKRKGIIPINSKETTINRESQEDRAKASRVLQAVTGQKGFAGFEIDENYADAYDTEGEYIFPSNSKFKILSTNKFRTKLFDKDAGYRNLDMQVQQLQKGGVVQRKVGYIDYDVIANEANKAIVEKGMEVTGQKGPRLYTDYLTDLAVKARKESSIQKLRAIYGVAGSGKTTLARGQGTDDARLRKTERFPILTPEDIQKATEVLVLSSSVSKNKLDDMFSATDRTYTLSSTTQAEKEKVKAQRITRDITGVGLEGRQPGVTSSVGTDTAVGEALLGDRLGKRSVVLGRSQDGKLRRKSGNELVEVIKKKIGFTWGGYSPMTAGHESIMDAAAAMGIPPEDFIYLVGANEGVDAKNYRTAIFDQDARVLLAKAGAGARGATVLPKPRDFEVPQAFDLSEPGQRRKVLVPAKGSTTFVADKTAEETEKYKTAGYKVKHIERTGVLENGKNTPISGTLVRDLIKEGNLAKLQSVLSPGVYELISNNIGRIQNRANILPSIIGEVQQTQGVKLEEVEKEIKALGISRIDSKKLASDPEYAAQVEVLKELRAKRDKIKSAGSFEPYRLLAALAAKEPDKYGLDFSTPAITDIKPVRTVSQKVQRANVGGLIQKFMAGGAAEEPDPMTDALAATKSRKEILDLLKTRKNGLQDTAKEVGVSTGEIFGIMGTTNPDEKTKALQEAIRREYVKTYNRQAGAARGTTKKLEDKGLVFAAAGMFGKPFPPENIDIVSDRLKKSAKVRVISGVMDKVKADQIDQLFTQGSEDLAEKAALIVSGGSSLTGKTISNPNAEGSIQGGLIEKMVQKLGGPGKTSGQGFDFPNGLQGAAKYFNIDPDLPTDVKRTLEGPSTFTNNIVTYLKNVRGYAKGGKVDYYSLEKNSGFAAREFDTLAQYAKANDFSLDEFQSYLKQRSSYKSQNAQLRMNPASLLRAVTPEPARATKKQLELAQQLKGEPDAGYRPTLTDAQRLAASRAETRASALTDINNATRYAIGGVATDDIYNVGGATHILNPKEKAQKIREAKILKAQIKEAESTIASLKTHDVKPGLLGSIMGRGTTNPYQQDIFENEEVLARLQKELNNITGPYGSQLSKFAGGGAVSLYHGSNTGVNDSVLESFKKEGAKSGIAQGYGQGAGFYVYSGKEKAKEQAMMRVKAGLGSFAVVQGDTAGKPMVLTFSEILDSATWDLDYELNKGSVVKWLAENYDKIKDKVAPKLTANERLTGIKDVVRSDSSKGIMSDGIRVQSDIGSRSTIYSGTDTNIREGELVGQIMNRLKAQDPKMVGDFENTFFNSPSLASGEWNNLALKYVGSSPLKPTNIETFATGGVVPGVGNRDTVPAMLNAGDFVIRKNSTQKLGVNNIASISGFAKGGQVPALLTPGEFVIPRENAQKIGYGTLNRMNKFGKYNAGGTVGLIQRFAEGTGPEGATEITIGPEAEKEIKKLREEMANLWMMAGRKMGYSQAGGSMKEVEGMQLTTGARRAMYAARPVQSGPELATRIEKESGKQLAPETKDFFENLSPQQTKNAELYEQGGFNARYDQTGGVVNAYETGRYGADNPETAASMKKAVDSKLKKAEAELEKIAELEEKIAAIRAGGAKAAVSAPVLPDVPKPPVTSLPPPPPSPPTGGKTPDGGGPPPFRFNMPPVPSAIAGIDPKDLELLQDAASKSGKGLLDFSKELMAASQTAKQAALDEGKSLKEAGLAAQDAAAKLLNLPSLAISPSQQKAINKGSMTEEEAKKDNQKARDSTLPALLGGIGAASRLVKNNQNTQRTATGQPRPTTGVPIPPTAYKVPDFADISGMADISKLKDQLAAGKEEAASKKASLTSRQEQLVQQKDAATSGPEAALIQSRIDDIDRKLKKNTDIIDSFSTGIDEYQDRLIKEFEVWQESIAKNSKEQEDLQGGLKTAYSELVNKAKEAAGADWASMTEEQKTASVAKLRDDVNSKEGMAVADLERQLDAKKTERSDTDLFMEARYGGAKNKEELVANIEGGTSAGKAEAERARTEAEAQEKIMSVARKKATLATGGQTSGAEFNKYRDQFLEEANPTRTTVSRKNRKDQTLQTTPEEKEKETKSRDTKIQQGSEKAKINAEMLLIKAILDNTKTIRACQCKDVRGDTGADNTDSIEKALGEFENNVSELNATIKEKNDAEAAAESQPKDEAATGGDEISIIFVDILDSLSAKAEKAGNVLNAKFSDAAGNVTKFGLAAKGIADTVSQAAARTANGLASLNEQFVNTKVGSVFKSLSSLKGLLGGFTATAGLSRAAEAAGGYETTAGTALNVGSSVAEFATSVGTAGSQLGPFGTAVGAAVGALAGLAKGLYDAANAAEEERLRLLNLAKDDSAEKANADFATFFDSTQPNIDDFNSGLKNLSDTISTENEIIKSSMGQMSLNTRDYFGIGSERGKTGKELSDASAALAGARSASGSTAKNIISQTMSKGQTDLAGAQRMLGGETYNKLTQSVANADAKYIESTQQAINDYKTGKITKDQLIKAEQSAKDAVMRRNFSEQQIIAANEDFRKTVTEARKRLESQGTQTLETIIGNTPEQNRDMAKNMKAAEGVFAGDNTEAKKLEQKAYEEAYATASGTELDKQKAGEQAAAKSRSDVNAAGNLALSFMDPKSQEYRNAKAMQLETQLKGMGVDTKTGIAGKALESLRQADPELEAQAKLETALLDNTQKLGENTAALDKPPSPIVMNPDGSVSINKEYSAQAAGVGERAQEAVLGNSALLNTGATAVTTGITTVLANKVGGYMAGGKPVEAEDGKTKAVTAETEAEAAATKKPVETPEAASGKKRGWSWPFGGGKGAKPVAAEAPEMGKPRFGGSASGGKKALGALVGLGTLAYGGYKMFGGGGGAAEETPSATGGTEGEEMPASPEIVGLLGKIEENTRNCCGGGNGSVTSDGKKTEYTSLPETGDAKATQLETQLKANGVDTTKGMAAKTLQSLRGEEPKTVSEALTHELTTSAGLQDFAPSAIADIVGVSSARGAPDTTKPMGIRGKAMGGINVGMQGVGAAMSFGAMADQLSQGNIGYAANEASGVLAGGLNAGGGVASMLGRAGGGRYLGLAGDAASAIRNTGRLVSGQSLENGTIAQDVISLGADTAQVAAQAPPGIIQGASNLIRGGAGRVSGTASISPYATNAGKFITDQLPETMGLLRGAGGGLGTAAGAVASKVNPAMAVADLALGAYNGYNDKKRDAADRGGLERGVLGALTGSASTGGSMTGKMMGLQEGGTADVTMGGFESMGRGAMIGAAFGGLPGAAIGAGVGATAELVKAESARRREGAVFDQQMKESTRGGLLTKVDEQGQIVSRSEGEKVGMSDFKNLSGMKLQLAQMAREGQNEGLAQKLEAGTVDLGNADQMGAVQQLVDKAKTKYKEQQKANSGLFGSSDKYNEATSQLSSFEGITKELSMASDAKRGNLSVTELEQQNKDREDKKLTARSEAAAQKEADDLAARKGMSYEDKLAATVDDSGLNVRERLHLREAQGAQEELAQAQTGGDAEKIAKAQARVQSIEEGRRSANLKETGKAEGSKDLEARLAMVRSGALPQVEAATEYTAQQAEQPQVAQGLTSASQLTGVSRSGFGGGPAAPAGTAPPTMFGSGVLDQAKAEYDQIEAEKAKQAAAAAEQASMEQAKQAQTSQQGTSYNDMLQQTKGNLLGELPGAGVTTPTSPQQITPTPSPGVISSMTQSKAGGTPEISNLAGIDPAAISEALSGTFNNFITALQNIQLPKIPEVITMEGRHTVEVIINGGEALKAIDQGIKDMVTDKINEAMKNINNKTEGGFGP